MYPKKRKKHLIVEKLPDETLVYDLTRHKALCLNQSASTVWQHCDGKTGVDELAGILEQKLAVPRSEHLVRLALNRLERAHLLVAGSAGDLNTYRCSRREAVRRFGLAGILGTLIPIVVSLTAPTAASAVTCIPDSYCIANPRAYVSHCCCTNRKKCTTSGCKGTKC